MVSSAKRNGNIVQQMSIEPYTCMVRYHHKRYYAELDYMQL